MEILITNNQYLQLAIEILEYYHGPFEWSFQSYTSNHKTVENKILTSKGGKKVMLINKTQKDTDYYLSVSILSEIEQYLNTNVDDLYDLNILHKLFIHYAGYYPLGLQLVYDDEFFTPLG